MEKNKIYISLPIAGQEKAAREKADRIKAELAGKGFEPISPFDIYAGKKPNYDDHLCHDLRAMMDCDAVFFCHGWEKSCGCGIENYTALRMKAYGRKNFRIMYEH